MTYPGFEAKPASMAGGCSDHYTNQVSYFKYNKMHTIDKNAIEGKWIFLFYLPSPLIY